MMAHKDVIGCSVFDVSRGSWAAPQSFRTQPHPAAPACHPQARGGSLPDMIADTLEQRHRYTGLSPRFAAAFEFLEKLPARQPAGRCDLDGNNCYALVQAYKTRPLAQAAFEAHRQYIDIQFLQTGRETLLWTPLAALTQVTQPYAAEKDITFFAPPPHWTPVNLHAGQFAVFFPEDGHAPGLESGGQSEVRKVVIKVRV